MQKVAVHILAKTIGENAAAVEQQYSGELAEKDGVHYCFYRETGEGMEGVRTTLRWREDCLVISRSGAVESRQEFRPGFCCRSVYKTPYLTIPLVSTTESLWIVSTAGQHRLQVVYDLAHGEEPYGRMEILIEIEEKQA